ncbi:MAG: hypothetical protein KatS3mg004_1045 [Bryobacteraceae bacterium]|nr:MAG: hypothetical protein KatS3mg004_1045 [Bryobacteraceae bacterium]
MRKPGIHQLSVRRRGASLVEFGLGAMMFFLLYFGVMDWAWTFFQHQTITWRVSDAARWAAANRANDVTTIQNIILCGTTSGCGSTSNPFFSIGNISVQLFSKQDQIDPSGTFPAITRYYVQVTVQGYQIRHFIPGFSGTATGRPITSVQPMECQKADGNCQDWN